jgi:hypothetical protein
MRPQSVPLGAGGNPSPSCTQTHRVHVVSYLEVFQKKKKTYRRRGHSPVFIVVKPYDDEDRFDCFPPLFEDLLLSD